MSNLVPSLTEDPRVNLPQQDGMASDTVEGQFMTLNDQVNQVLLNNQVASAMDYRVPAKPGITCEELIAVAGGATFVTVSKMIGTLVAVTGYAGGIPSATNLGITAAAAASPQSATPGKINLTGTVLAGLVIVKYVSANGNSF